MTWWYKGGGEGTWHSPCEGQKNVLKSIDKIQVMYIDKIDFGWIPDATIVFMNGCDVSSESLEHYSKREEDVECTLAVSCHLLLHLMATVHRLISLHRMKPW